MITYDANRQPDARRWLSASEDDRIEAVRAYHGRMNEPHPEIPHPEMHWTIHVIVENQVALGDETPAHGTVARLMTEGLSRHEAVHAVGFVLADHLVDIMRSPATGTGNAEYYRRLESLTPDSWRREATDESAPPRRFPKRPRRSR